MKLLVGPFEKALSNANAFGHSMARSYVFNELIKEMEKLEEHLNSEDNNEAELAKIMYDQLEKQLLEMIAINEKPYGKESKRQNI